MSSLLKFVLLDELKPVVLGALVRRKVGKSKMEIRKLSVQQLGGIAAENSDLRVEVRGLHVAQFARGESFAREPHLNSE